MGYCKVTPPVGYMADLQTPLPLHEEVAQRYDQDKERLRFSAIDVDAAMQIVAALKSKSTASKVSKR